MGQEGEVMPSRLPLLALSLILPVWSQSKDSGPEPLQIVTRTAAANGSELPGQKNSGIGLFLDIHNTSGKNVTGYALAVKFLDPSTNATFKGAGSHQKWVARQAGNPIHPGDCDCSQPKPIMLPKTPSGAAAESKVTLDLVVFDDGTTWGPGQLLSSQQLLRKLGMNLTPR
jgi:hypothetical protein